MQFVEIVSLVDKIRRALILADLHPMVDTHASFDLATNLSELQEYYKTLKDFVNRNITIRMVLLGGGEAVEAAKVSPWCINEGLATGEEFIYLE